MVSLEQLPEIGATAYLKPSTKLASAICHARCEVIILGFGSLPYVLVRLPNGDECEIHHLNIALHPPRKAGKTDSDQTGGHEQRRTPTLSKSRVRLELATGEEEQTLW